MYAKWFKLAKNWENTGIFRSNFSKFWFTGFPVLGPLEPSWVQPDMPATHITANYSKKYQQL